MRWPGGRSLDKRANLGNARIIDSPRFVEVRRQERLRPVPLIDRLLPAFKPDHDAPSTRRPRRAAGTGWQWSDRDRSRRPRIGFPGHERRGDAHRRGAAVLREAGAPAPHQALLPVPLVGGEGPQGGAASRQPRRMDEGGRQRSGDRARVAGAEPADRGDSLRIARDASAGEAAGVRDRACSNDGSRWGRPIREPMPRPRGPRGPISTRAARTGRFNRSPNRPCRE